MGAADRIADLERQLADLGRQLEELRRENQSLREENATLRKELEEWRRGHRERKKRRSSRTEGKRKASGKKPGRAAGHPGAARRAPDRIDRTQEHPVPERCACGGATEPTGEQESTIVEDIPPVRVEHVRHIAHVGRCVQCGHKVVAPLPGATTNGRTVAETQVGPNAQALAISLRFDHKMPLAHISGLMDTWFGLSITPGGLVHMFARLGERAQPSCDEILRHIRMAPVVGADETGLHQSGLSGWAWLARTDRASLFRIELSRGSWVIESILGSNFEGILCSDFYAAYTRRDDWHHAYCGAHVIREAKKIAEVSPCERTEAFSDAICNFYHDAKQAQCAGSASAQHGIRVKLGKLIANADFGLQPDVARVQHRLDEHFHGVLRFVDDRDIPADNNATERDIRSLATFRKVTGGTRSPAGSLTLGRWMSITQTLRKNDLPLRNYIVGLRDAHLYGRPPPSVFAPN